LRERERERERADKGQEGNAIGGATTINITTLSLTTLNIKIQRCDLI
jgi:hypothetical protein